MLRSADTYKILINLCLIFSTGIYVEGVATNVVGVMALACQVMLVTLLAASHFRLRLNSVAVVTTLFFVYSVLGVYESIDSANSVRQISDSVRYPIGLFLSIIIVACLRERLLIAVIEYLTVAGIVFAVFQLCALYIREFQIGPIEITRYQSSNFYFFTLPTAAGAFSNTNYLATFLNLTAVAMLSQLADHDIRSRRKIGLIISLGLTIVAMVHTGSRAGVAILLVLITIFCGLMGLVKLRTLIMVGVPLMLVLSVAIARSPDSVQLSPVVNAFFYTPGLDGRGDRVHAGIAAIAADPGGYGFGGQQNAVVDAGAVGASVQNSYLTYILFGGIKMLIVYIFICLLVIYKLIRSFALDRVWLFASGAFVVILVDSMVRSYMLGGTGIIPLILTYIVCHCLCVTKVRNSGFLRSFRL